LEEVEEQIAGVHGNIDDGRKRVKDLGEQIVELKDEQSELIERRKELWREDTKLSSLVSHASDERRSAENNLASMMDKVPCFLLSSSFTRKLNLNGVLGHGDGSTCC
jgi:structural maintenance of chromosome 3 (chondroitin sulfate proteoglycan 6)